MEKNPYHITIGVVGLGLMGSSIATCFLIAGHSVVGVAGLPIDLKTGSDRIKNHLKKAKREKMFEGTAASLFKKIQITDDYSCLKDCHIVVETVVENIDIKKEVLQKIEKHVSKNCIITTNTSAIPISTLQKFIQTKPERFLGLHWIDPAHATRFLEIICGNDTDVSLAEYLYELATLWQKEPVLLKKDIPGFVTNRLMYAVYREACAMVDQGYVSVEDVDRALRNTTGYYIGLTGVFRWMDLTGVHAYHAVMKNLLPTLNNDQQVPKLIDDIVKAGGKGTQNAHGFYEYTADEAKLWEETYQEYSYAIRDLALKYPHDVVKKKLNKKLKN